MNNSMLSRYRQKIYLILANVGLILLFYSIWEIEPVTVVSGDFLGLTSKLTITYWIGLLLITLCSILIYLDNGIKNNKILIYVLIIVGLFVIGLGVFVEENPRISVSYYPIGEVKNILVDGHVDITTPYPLISYRSWLGLHLISANIIYLSNIELIDIVKYMSIFWIVVFVVITFSIGKKLRFSKNECFLLSFLAITSFWTSHDYYSPQSFAFLIYLVVFLFVITVNNDNATKKCLSIIMFSALVITHLLTTVSVLLSLFMVLLYSKDNKDNRVRSNEFILFCIIFIAWHIFVASTIIKWSIPEVISSVVNMESLSVVNSRLHPTTLIESLTKILHFSYILIFLIPVGVFLFNRKKDRVGKQMLISILVWILGTVFIIVGVYGTEIFERLYLFSSVPLICFSIMLFKNYKYNSKIFVGIIIIFVGMSVPAYYGNEVLSLTYTTELKGSEFTSNVLDNESYFYILPNLMYYYKPNLISVKNSMFYFSYNDSLIDTSKYVVDSIQSDTNLIFRFGFNPEHKWIIKENNELNLLYNNGNFSVYRNMLIQS